MQTIYFLVIHFQLKTSVLASLFNKYLGLQTFQLSSWNFQDSPQNWSSDATFVNNDNDNKQPNQARLRLTDGLSQRTPEVLDDLGPSSLNPREDAVAGKYVSSNSLPLCTLWAFSRSKSWPKNLTALWFWPRPPSRSHWLLTLKAMPVAQICSSIGRVQSGRLST